MLDRLTSEVDPAVHLAASVGAKLIVENPVHTVETNIMGTEMMLNVANRMIFTCPAGCGTHRLAQGDTEAQQKLQALTD